MLCLTSLSWAWDWDKALVTADELAPHTTQRPGPGAGAGGGAPGVRELRVRVSHGVDLPPHEKHAEFLRDPEDSGLDLWDGNFQLHILLPSFPKQRTRYYYHYCYS